MKIGWPPLHLQIPFVFCHLVLFPSKFKNKYGNTHVWIEGMTMNGLPPAAKKVYIFNQSTKNLLEGQLDSIISRAVEHIMMLGFYKHKSYTHLTTTIRWCSAKTKLRKRMCRAGENRLKRNFLVEKPVAIHTSLLKLWPGVVLISWLSAAVSSS